MKKAIVTTGLLFTTFALIISCKKDKTGSDKQLEGPNIISTTNLITKGGFYSDDYYAQLVLNQSNSVNADYKKLSFTIDKFANNTFDIVETLYNKGGVNLVSQWKSLVASHPDYNSISLFYTQNNIDSSLMFDKKSEILAAFASFYEATPNFIQLDSARQITIFKMVFDSLKNEQYRNNHTTNPLVITFNNIVTKFSTTSNPNSRLTMEEVGDCLRDAVIGTIANSIGVIRQLWNAISGYNLEWSGIIRVAKSALQSIASSNAIVGLVGFGLCIAWETFF